MPYRAPLEREINKQELEQLEWNLPRQLSQVSVQLKPLLRIQKVPLI